MKRLQHVAWILILIVDVGYIAWEPRSDRRFHRLVFSRCTARSTRRSVRTYADCDGRESTIKLQALR